MAALFYRIGGGGGNMLHLTKWDCAHSLVFVLIEVVAKYVCNACCTREWWPYQDS